jgi:hypothetical protein
MGPNRCSLEQRHASTPCDRSLLSPDARRQLTRADRPGQARVAPTLLVPLRHAGPTGLRAKQEHEYGRARALHTLSSSQTYASNQNDRRHNPNPECWNLGPGIHETRVRNPFPNAPILLRTNRRHRERPGIWARNWSVIITRHQELRQVAGVLHRRQ